MMTVIGRARVLCLLRGSGHDVTRSRFDDASNWRLPLDG